MPAQQCIQGRADRRNLASAPLIPTRSPDPAPTTTKSSRRDGFCHPLHHGQIAIARGTFRTSTPRGFLPWTLSDDGPGAFPRCRNGPSSETLHRRRRSLPFNVSWHHLRGKNAKGRFDPAAPCGEIDLSNDQPSVRTIRQESTGSIEAVFVELDKDSQLWPAVSIAGDCFRCQIFEGEHGATLVRTLARYRPHWRDDDKAVAVMGEKIGG